MADEKQLIDLENLSHFKAKQDLENLNKFKLKSDSTDLIGAVRYDTAQVLTEEQKAQAIQNLGLNINEGGDTVVAEEEIYVIVTTLDSETTGTITQETADFLNNYTGDKPLYLKVEPIGLYLLYDATSGAFGIARGSQILTVYVNTEQLSTFVIIEDVISVGTDGKIPTDLMPDLGFYDDVVEGYYNTENNVFYEDANFTTSINGKAGKIYLDLSTNNTYRWGDTTYVRINPDEYTVATNADIDALFT